MPAPDGQTLWHVPYRHNPFFTGREDLLSDLYQGLHVENIVALCHPVGISGLGGMGKTQTALEYAYRNRASYDAVFWVQADSATALTSGYVALAQLLQLPECNALDQRKTVEAVLRWFRVYTSWLLILDNMDDLSVAEPFLPNASRGHILFTTRAHALGGIAPRLEVPPMEPETGALLLLRRASMLPLPASLDEAARDDRSLACEISQELDGFPLALDQAGAYVKETPCLLPDYLTRYRTRRQDLLQQRGSLDQDYPASVATTWSLSFEKVSQAHPAVAELLNLCAFLAPDAIPEEIFITGSSHLGDVLAPVAANPVQLDQTCKEALRFSLFTRETDAQTLTMHRLVQAVLQDNLSHAACTDWKYRAVKAVDAAFPLVSFDNWASCGRMLPHVMICVIWTEQEHMTLLEAARLFSHTGHYLQDRTHYKESESLCKYVLSFSEQQMGPEHPDTADCLNNLANLYLAQRKYGQAEPLLKRATSIYEQHLGPEDPNIANCLSNLARLYLAQRKYEQAEPLLQRVQAQALHIYEQALSHPQQPLLSYAPHNLANRYSALGKYEQAEPLYLHALQIQEVAPQHPVTAFVLNDMANHYSAQRKYEQAEPLYHRALQIWELVHGPQHPQMTSSLTGLANLYKTQGKYEQAEPLYQRALQFWEQDLSPQHLQVAYPLSNLASLYQRQGKYEQAELLYRRALTIHEQELGGDHLDTAQSLHNLADLYYAQGKYEEAELLYVRVLAISERQLGSMHPEMVTSLNNLANIYQTQGKYAEAKPLYQRALAIGEPQKRSFPLADLSHPPTFRSRV